MKPLYLIFCVAGFALLSACDSIVVDCEQQCDSYEAVYDELSCEVVRSRSSCINACEDSARDLPSACVKEANKLIDCQDDAPLSEWSCPSDAESNPAFSIDDYCDDRLGDLLTCLSEN